MPAGFLIPIGVVSDIVYAMLTAIDLWLQAHHPFVSTSSWTRISRIALWAYLRVVVRLRSCGHRDPLR